MRAFIVACIVGIIIAIVAALALDRLLGGRRLLAAAVWEHCMAFDEKTADRVRGVLSDRRDVVERKMMGGLCFMVKGGMCCSVSGRGGLLVRI